MNAVVHETKFFVRGMVLATIAALLLTGCAGVMHPYVRPSDPAKHPFRQGNTSLNQAICYADNVRGAYRDALKNQGLLSTGLGLVLIPLTGIVAYQGIIGASTKAIAATSITGASLLGAGVYMHSSPRQIVYAEAAAAITCAISVVAPLQLSEDDVTYLRNLVQPKTPTGGAKPAPQAAGTQAAPQAGGTQANAPPADGKKNLPYMLQVVSRVSNDTDATKLAEQIRTGLSSGRESLAIIDMAGSQLVSTVDGIVDKADKQIAATIPDPRTLSSGLGGLIPVPKVGAVDLPTLKDLEKKPPATGAKSEDITALDSALQSNGLTRDDILEALTFVAWVAERVKEAAVKTGLSGCGGALENVTTAFRLVPETTTISFTSGKAGEYRSVVVGGKPPYYANLLRKPDDGTLTADLLSEPAGYQLRISADGNLKAGDYQVAVRDSSAVEPKLVTVRVEQPKPTPPPAQNPQPAPAVTKKPG
jgi:hypothetical protein